MPTGSTLSTTSPRSSSLPENPFTGLIRYVSVNCFFLKVSGGTCSICHEDFVLRDMVNRLPCSHIFHTRCILRWLKRSNTCPLCRSKVHKEEPARPKETHGQPIRIMRLNRESFHRVPTSQSRPAPTSRNVTRSVENEAHIPQSRPTPTARNIIPSVQNEDHGDAVSCVTLDEAGDTLALATLILGCTSPAEVITPVKNSNDSLGNHQWGLGVLPSRASAFARTSTYCTFMLILTQFRPAFQLKRTLLRPGLYRKEPPSFKSEVVSAVQQTN
ncbi:hypothetical protein RJ639_001846 [Escallonia herrerae]|uniref:RING-type domain-containing protein n=1 Tax=Escallonia herrerae TaxID=1293975 RepID=A0AA88X9T7_9ASTE|nr:hypothetical protein RJ639_001846 [Escallonia herrerae]